jgi:hypothetical protein
VEDHLYQVSHCSLWGALGRFYRFLILFCSFLDAASYRWPSIIVDVGCDIVNQFVNFQNAVHLNSARCFVAVLNAIAVWMGLIGWWTSTGPLFAGVCV